MKILKFIFAAENRGNHKVITIFGLKLKFKRKPKLAPRLENIERRLDDLKYLLSLSLDITKMPKNPTVTGKIQQASLNMLAEFDRICRRHNLKYWLDFGTLLGARRHSGFIPWDDDIDVGMPYADYVKFIDVINGELENTDFCFIKVPSQIGKICYRQFSPKTQTELIDFINWTLKGKLAFALDIYPYYNLKEGISMREARELLLGYEKKRSFVLSRFSKFDDFYKLEDIVAECRQNLSQENYSEFIYRGIEVVATNPGVRKIGDMFPLKEMRFENLSCFVPRNPENILIDTYGDFMDFPPDFYFRHIKNNSLDAEELKKLEEIVRK